MDFGAMQEITVSDCESTVNMESSELGTLKETGDSGAVVALLQAATWTA